MITRNLLRSLRNDLPMDFTIRQLGNKAPYSKCAEGRFRFQCPHCKETLAAVNPRNNLGHCFHCKKNMNNIDLMLQCGYEFLDAVTLLEQWLHLYNGHNAGHKIESNPTGPVGKSQSRAESIGPILRQEFGDRGPKVG